MIIQMASEHPMTIQTEYSVTILTFEYHTTILTTLDHPLTIFTTSEHPTSTATSL